MKKQKENLEDLENKTNCDCEKETCNCADCFCEETNEESCSCENIESECREDEFKETLQRIQAEFDNYRKRAESQKDKQKEDGIVYAINKLLPVLDSFKSAKAMITDDKFLESLNLIEKQFIHGLENLNITKIEAEDCEFDPNLHNAVLTGTDETKKDDTILEVFQDGYKLNDRVIRYSVVKINKLYFKT